MHVVHGSGVLVAEVRWQNVQCRRVTVQQDGIKNRPELVSQTCGLSVQQVFAQNMVEEYRRSNQQKASAHEHVSHLEARTCRRCVVSDDVFESTAA